ncbi:MAG: hypothetical protein JNL18_10245, partial [Planctomycetaceae bacterium]|nr:hypothetical protein [Planctomycetaceae bacterium]
MSAGSLIAAAHRALEVTTTTVATPPVDHAVLVEPDFWVAPQDAGAASLSPMLVGAHTQTGWYNVQSNYGLTGAGQTVAVIDSGIAWNHAALGGGWGANYRVVGGWDFTEENDANPYDDGPSGSQGTHVAGVIGSSDSTYPGVAAGVDLVGLRVVNDAGEGYFSWLESALQWVHANRNAFANPITTVNLSLGVAQWNATTMPNWSTLEDEFAQLKADGIFIAAAAGNSFTQYNAPGLSYPAASSNVVPVMSTDGSGNLSFFSQRHTRAIAAPGEGIVSTVPDYAGNNNGTADDFATRNGTHLATPYIAGASVLIRQAMQFAGVATINQDVIYDKMMATADSVVDAVTGLTYKRLNLARAIDSIMPADDVGSTTATALDLGTLTTPINRQGAIGTITDADFFKFTASANGVVTFAASTAGAMTAQWQVTGASPLAGQPPGTIAFAVQAGQVYTVRLASTSGIGKYTLTASLAPSNTFEFTDLGNVDSKQVNDVSVAGEKWFRVVASQNGLFSALGSFNAAGGSVSVSLHDANLNVVTSGVAGAGTSRVDATVVAGVTYYVRLAGTNSDVDVKLVNLVSQVGSKVWVNGTAGTDTFQFTAGSTSVIVVNGLEYRWGTTSVNSFVVNGLGGVDSFAFQGTTAAESVTLRSTESVFTGTGYSVTVSNVETQTAVSGGGADVANLYDSAGNDSLAALPDRLTLTLSGGQVLSAQGFAKAKAWATAGGVDTAAFTDSAGDDTFIAGQVRAIMAGVGYWNEAEGFDQTTADAVAGGVNQINFYDSAGNDAVTAWSNRVTLTGAGFSHDARGFAKSITYGDGGGTDVAT